jgi:hypothetical protein
MDYLFLGPAGSDRPAAMEGGGNRAGAPPSPDDMILDSFRSHSWDAAMALFNQAKAVGIRTALSSAPEPSREFWTSAESTGHLQRAVRRLGVGASAIGRAEAEPTIKAVNGRIGQLFGEYQKVRGPQRENRDWTPVQQRHAEGILVGCEYELGRATTVAVAIQTMVDAGRAAYGLPPRSRPFRIVANNDEAITSEVVALRTEVARLRSEHAELLGQNQQLAAMVESHTKPAAPVADPEPVPAAVEPVAPRPAAPSLPSRPANPRPPQKG